MTSDVQGTQMAWYSAELDVAPCCPKALRRVLCTPCVARVPRPRGSWSSVQRNAGTTLLAWGSNAPLLHSLSPSWWVPLFSVIWSAQWPWRISPSDSISQVRTPRSTYGRVTEQTWLQAMPWKHPLGSSG